MFYQPDTLTEEEEKILATPEAQKVLAWFVQKLPTITNWETEEIQNIINAGITALGIKGKAFYIPLRLALIGKMHGPELPSTFAIIGLEESLQRLKCYLLKNEE